RGSRIAEMSGTGQEAHRLAVANTGNSRGRPRWGSARIRDRAGRDVRFGRTILPKLRWQRRGDAGAGFAPGPARRHLRLIRRRGCRRSATDAEDVQDSWDRAARIFSAGP